MQTRQRRRFVRLVFFEGYLYKDSGQRNGDVAKNWTSRIVHHTLR